MERTNEKRAGKEPEMRFASEKTKTAFEKEGFNSQELRSLRREGRILRSRENKWRGYKLDNGQVREIEIR